MQQKLTASPDFVIRPMATQVERETYRRLSHITFNPTIDVETAIERRMASAEQASTFRPEQTRGAFLGNTFLGGYHIAERNLCIGPNCTSRLLTGCIGGVVTRSEHRQQGVAFAMLHDAVNFAKANKHALILLDGISDFYHRFGFIDVIEKVEHFMSRQLIEAQPASPYTIREATLEDAPAMLELYQRHFGSYTGSFERDKKHQEHLIRYRSNSAPFLALDETHTPRGYMMLFRQPDSYFAYEVAADNWAATLALLQQYLKLNVQVNSACSEVSWELPLNSPTFYALTDHLHATTRTSHHPDADWMARIGDARTLVEAMIPTWKTHWLHRPHTLEWSGTLALSIDDAGYSGTSHFLLGLDANGVYLLDQMTSTTHAAQSIRLRQQVFTQLIFGHRPVSWAAQQEGQNIPEHIQPILTALFPTGNAWIAGTDAF